jgi:hypothetical protein
MGLLTDTAYEILRTSSSLMMEAARTSETSADNYFTRQYIPEDNSELHTRRRENLKSHILKTIRNLVTKSNSKLCVKFCLSLSLSLREMDLNYYINREITVTFASNKYHSNLKMAVSGMLRSVVLQKWTDVSELLTPPSAQ